MSKPWQEGWFQFQRHSGGSITLVMIDRVALDHAPEESHGFVCMVVLPVQEPTPLGLPGGDENRLLQLVSDRVQAVLESELDGWRVARLTGGGLRCDVFLVARGDAPSPALARACAPYVPQVSVRHDPGWKALAALAPNDRERISGENLQVIYRLIQEGDQVTVPRRIDHVALFDDAGAADRAAGELRERGFEVDAPRAHDTQVVLQFHREDTVDVGMVERFTDQILGVVVTAGGAYDGWGSPIVTAAP